MQSNAPRSESSQVAHIGIAAGRSCGYCKSKTGSQAFYLRALTLTPLHYQKLLDLGWRRSGNLLYRPNLKRSCCVQYTIRLDARQFKPSREHRKGLHRWERYVLGSEYIDACAILYPISKEEKKLRQTSFDLLKNVHGPEYPHLKTPPEPEKKFEVTIEASIYTEEKFELYQHYQQVVHKESLDSISKDGFRNFLCQTPVQCTEPNPADGSRRLGSFHQMYRLDGRLIAMAILDFLPWCVSGVYFIYHKDFEKFGFGKLSACREAALALEEGYKYYYMGFYIHTAPKMRYKAEFHPSYILDPETNEWNIFDEKMRKIMDEKIYCSLSKPDESWEYKKISEEESEMNQTDVGELSIWDAGMPGVHTAEEIEKLVELGNIKISFRGGHFTADKIVQFHKYDSDLRNTLREYASAIGPELATEIELRF